MDTVRLTMILAGPPEADIDWADVSPGGTARFLSRALDLSDRVNDGSPQSMTLRRTTHRLLKTITALVEARRFNMAVARTMELVGAARAAIDDGYAAREAVEAVAVILSLFAPRGLRPRAPWRSPWTAPGTPCPGG